MPDRQAPGPRLATARTDLDPLTVDDAEQMAAVLADPGLYTFIGGGPPQVDALRERYEVLVRGRSADGTQDWFNWVVRLRDGGAAAGYVQATVVPADDAAEVAWVLGTPWQGRGYAAEASGAVVGWLLGAGTGTVLAHVHPEHAASEAVARRCGLVPTGRFDEDGEQRWELVSGAGGAPGRPRTGTPSPPSRG